jgi:hypothetical protein
LSPKALTANELRSGLVVFLAPDGRWTPDLNEADLAAEADRASGLEQAGKAAVAERIVVDPYLFEVERTGAGLRPAHIRERIRTLGPTVRTDLGKQADGIGGSVGPVEITEA